MHRFIHAQSGNVFTMVLIGVVLFGALAFTFMRSGRQGMSNVSAQEASIGAQEILNFLNQVDSAYNRLRVKKCSVDDISFSNSGDTGSYVANNDTISAPPDKSCHIFDVNGGKVTFNMDWKKYQLPERLFPTGALDAYGNINFRNHAVSTQGLGTAANDRSAQLNYMTVDICAAYNRILNLDIDLSVSDAGPIAGDENAALIGKQTFCRWNGTTYQLRYTYLAQ